MVKGDWVTLVAGVMALHASRVIYRDLKPSIIALTYWES